MGMTMREKRGRKEVQKLLAKQGYPRYAKLLNDFDFNITNNPNITAFIEYDKGRIVVNGTFDIDSISVVVRHELLHGFLKHHQRLLNHVAKSMGLDPDDLDDYDLNEIKQIVYSPTSPHNIVADFDISNQGYTDADKKAIRNLVLNGNVISGLVTEDHKPDWVDLSLEDMWDKAMEERQSFLNNIKAEQEQKAKEKQKEQNEKNKKPEFVDGELLDGGLVFVDENGVEYGF